MFTSWKSVHTCDVFKTTNQLKRARSVRRGAPVARRCTRYSVGAVLSTPLSLT
jgi:hypothetical protein